MEDNEQGLKNRTPFQTNQRVSLLSPTLDTWAGPQYGYGPFDEVPPDPTGFINSTEVPDEEFRSWPEGKSARASGMPGNKRSK